jgi:hypothetical protein
MSDIDGFQKKLVLAYHSEQGLTKALYSFTWRGKESRPSADLQVCAAECAQSWYSHVNGPLASGAHNGALYLVTGFDEARAWGVAAFIDVEELPWTLNPRCPQALVRQQSTGFADLTSHGHHAMPMYPKGSVAVCFCVALKFLFAEISFCRPKSARK